jgi:hypothetical protein
MFGLECEVEPDGIIGYASDGLELAVMELNQRGIPIAKEGAHRKEYTGMVTVQRSSFLLSFGSLPKSAQAPTLRKNGLLRTMVPSRLLSHTGFDFYSYLDPDVGT